MRKSLVIIDDFYADLEAVRGYALGCDWYEPYPKRGALPPWLATRQGPSAECPFRSSGALVDRLEQATGDQIDMDFWKATFLGGPDGGPPTEPGVIAAGALWNAVFHFKPVWNTQALGEGVHNHVTDAWNGVGVDGWVGLVYLDPSGPLDGGLKTFRNVDPAHDLDWMTPSDQWRLIDSLSSIPNRLILHRGDQPHSGSAGWGTSPESGRLYQTYFFRVARTANLTQLSLDLPKDGP